MKKALRKANAETPTYLVEAKITKSVYGSDAQKASQRTANEVHQCQQRFWKAVVFAEALSVSAEDHCRRTWHLHSRLEPQEIYLKHIPKLTGN